MKIFADSSALFAFFVEQDLFHQEAVDFISKHHEIITSSVVLHELDAIIAKRISRITAQKIGSVFFSKGIIELVVPTLDEEYKSFDMYEKSNIGKISWVDCSNAIIMRGLGLREIFAFDSDFEKLGLKVLP